MRVEGKTFIVTGAGSGIGKALTTQLIQRGTKIIALDLNDKALHDLKAQLDPEKLILVHKVDIADQKAIAKLADEIRKKGYLVDGIINSAGIIQPFVKVNELSYETVKKVFDVNFWGTLYLIKIFLPSLLERPEAHIVNISSMGGFLPVPGQGAYGASKAAVKLLSEALYAELMATNVHVTVVFPGATDTNITKNSGVRVPNQPARGQEKAAFTPLPAARAAEVIVDGIERNKYQVFTGKDSKFFNFLYRLNPRFATRFIAGQMKSLLEKENNPG